MEWAVTMEGFNRFLWDFEHSKNENLYGMFGSHGAMLVTNIESVLEAHDVERGWDWSKVPGATIIGWGNLSKMDIMKNQTKEILHFKSFACRRGYVEGYKGLRKRIVWDGTSSAAIWIRRLAKRYYFQLQEIGVLL